MPRGLMSSTGLTPPGMQQPGGPAAPQMPQAESNVTPEEQELYDHFVGAALNMVYDERVFPQLMRRIQAGASRDPLGALAETTAMVVNRTEEAALRDGKPLPAEIVLHGGSEVLTAIAEAAVEKGLHNYTPQEIEGAGYRALDIYREMAGDRLNESEIMADFNQIMQAEEQGVLGEMVPGLEAKFGGVRRGG